MDAPETTRLRCACADPAPSFEPATILEAAGFERAAEVLPDRLEEAPPACDLLDWASSGGMWLTGHPDGPPLPAPVPLLARFRKVTTALRLLTGELGEAVAAAPATLLFGRAALAGSSRRGRRSAGGTCRLLRAADGWVAVNLSRPDDVASVPAVVGDDSEQDPWRALEGVASEWDAAHLVDRCRLLGLPAGVVPATGATGARGAATSPLVVRRLAEPRRGARRSKPLVVDLSAMWAGPLCAHLLGRCGAEVVKVESTERLDGARAGDPAFFDWLHRGHESVVLDLGAPREVERLRRLLGHADVVIEGSRPRALRTLLGLDPADVVARRPGLTWISITGYGRAEPGARWVAFGDDAAAAGGLVADDLGGRPVFCGDALADPLAGTYAALAAVASLLDGGGSLVDVALQRVAAHLALRPPTTSDSHAVGAVDALGTVHAADTVHAVDTAHAADTVHAVEAAGAGRWVARHGERTQEVLAPREPTPAGAALPPGASNARVLDRLDRAPAP